MNRRHFLATAATAAAATALPARLSAATRPKGRPPRILLRGSWGSANIGDIGHTPGALSLLERYFPEAEITLWPGRLGHGSRDFLVKAFPRLRIAEAAYSDEGRIVLGSDGRPTTAELTAAWAETDFMVHGSGSGFGARSHLAAFHRATGKPYGVFSVSTDPISGLDVGRDPEGGTLADLQARAERLPASHLDQETRSIINQAAFMFTRETLSLDYLHRQGVRPPVLEFAPDSQLGMAQRDDARGHAYCRAHGLEPGRFLCVIPRLRYTPYYQIFNQKRVPTDDVRDAINARTTVRDHEPVREMIVSYVRQTGNRVLACPEMTHEIAVAREQLVDPLPADVKPHVVWRDTYWLPDEAASVYAWAQAVVSLECHSPLIAYAVGTPALYVRQPSDTWKGQMYRDLGLDDWLLEIEETNGPELWSRVADIHQDPARARRAVRGAMARVERQQRRMIDVLRTAVATVA